MRCVIQRVSEASVAVEEETVGRIGTGYMVLVGVGDGDVPGRALGVGSVPSTVLTPLLGETVAEGFTEPLGSGSRFFREVVIRMMAAAMMASSTTAPTITCQRVPCSTVEALPSRFFRAPQWGHLLRRAL